ncbi:MAG: hypothetical protein J2P17_33005 [Mycobacterium sp.]|nr:hypothetical protein [Mycobacterium sp.]
MSVSAVAGHHVGNEVGTGEGQWSGQNAAGLRWARRELGWMTTTARVTMAALARLGR